MAFREGSWWSRGWGAIALLGFALYLGAVVYEAVIIAPLWSLSPPDSVSAWVKLENRPDSSALFDPLVAVVLVASLMAWMSGVATRGWRRWWLTLACLAAGALAAIAVVWMMPCERQLFGVAALAGDDGAANVIALTGDWMRFAAARIVVIFLGLWAACRAQMAGSPAGLPGRSSAAARAGDDEFEEGSSRAGRRRRGGPRASEFAFGDEGEPEVTLGEKSSAPRQHWQSSLPRRSRTAKK